MCQGKTKYRQEKRARVFARDWRRRSPEDPMYHYHCRVCGWWHLSHKPEK
jgi:hypothetical protein